MVAAVLQNHRDIHQPLRTRLHITPTLRTTGTPVWIPKKAFWPSSSLYFFKNHFQGNLTHLSVLGFFKCYIYEILIWERVHETVKTFQLN